MKTCKSYGRDGKGNGASTASRDVNIEGLLRMYADKAYEVAYSLAGNRDEAEELVQQASYKAFKYRSSYEPLMSFRNWYLTIVTNAFNDSRGTFFRRRMVSLDASDSSDETFQLIHSLRDSGPGPLEQLERSEIVSAIRDSFAALKEAHRSVLSLCDIQRLSYQEAADQLGIPMATVRSRLHRARSALRSAPRIRALA